MSRDDTVLSWALRHEMPSPEGISPRHASTSTLVRPRPKARPLSTSDTPVAVAETALSADGAKVFARGPKATGAAHSTTDGRRLWEAPCNSYDSTIFTVTPESLFSAIRTGVTAFDAATGTQRWAYDARTKPYVLAAGSHRHICAARPGSLLRLRPGHRHPALASESARKGLRRGPPRLRRQHGLRLRRQHVRRPCLTNR
ncbi:hypothetical protein ACU686_14640 [Yinghuangia aomiensis]